MVKKSRYFILVLVLCLLFWAVPSKVYASYGITGSWSGNVTVIGSRTHAYLTYKNDFSYSYDSTTGDITSDSYYALYEMNMPVRLVIDGLVPGYIYSGRSVKSGEFIIEDTGIPASASLINNAEISVQNVNCADGISIDMSYYTVSNPSVMLFGVSFNNFCASDTRTIIDLTLKIRVRILNNANSNYISAVIIDPNDSGDTSGIVTYYSDLRDVPSNEGFFADQNQKIIDSINQHDQKVDSWFSDLKNNLSNWFSGVQTTLSNFFTPYFDNITNAFKKALSDTQETDNEVLSGAMNDYQAAEQEVFAPAMDSLTEFDFGSNDINSLGTGFVAAITFVSSCMSNLYSLTPFSGVFDVIATLGLASILIGLSRLWFGKDG